MAAYRKALTPAIVGVGLALLIGATLVRLWGIGWGLPYAYHADEPVNLTTTLTMLQDRDPNPRFFNYPPFYYYVEAGGQLTYFAIGAAVGEFESIDDITTPEMQTLANGRLENPNSLLTGRLLSVVFSVATVAIIYGAALAVSGSMAGAILAGLLTALGPLAVRRGRLMTPDPIAAFFTAATLAASFAVLRRGKTIDYALSGALVGLAASSKYHAALVATVVLGAHIMRTGKRFATDRNIYLAAGAAVATFVVTSPFVILDFQTFWSEITWKTDFYSGSQIGGDAGSLGLYARTVFTEFGVLLLLVPFAFTVRLFRSEAILAAGYAALYVMFVAAFVVRFDRHLLPALPAIALTIGLGLSGLIALARPWFAAHSVRWTWLRAAVIGVVLVVGLAIPIGRTINDAQRYSTDERAAAREWIDASIPIGSTILVDAYSPFVDPDRFEATGVSFSATAGGEASHYEYVTVAEQGSGRFLADPSAYPRQVASYAERFDSFCEIASFPGPPWIKVLSRDCDTP